MRGRHPPTTWTVRRRADQVRWKQTTNQLPDPAKRSGLTMVEQDGIRTKRGPYDFCLPLEFANYNLVEPVRAEALARFERHGIAWHHWTDEASGRRWPSSHLLSSQVQCVNVLLSLEVEPEKLLAWVRTLVPNAETLLPVRGEELVAFEWTGPEQADFLRERRGPAVQGRYQTSPDAVVLVGRPEGTTALLIEWKDTEFYREPVELKPRRIKTYAPLLASPDGPVLPAVPLEAYFHEPHYQLLRLHLLAAQFVRRIPRVIEALVVHAIPAGNNHLVRLVPPALAPLGDTVDAVWTRLQRPGTGVGYRYVDTSPLLQSTPHLAHRYAGGPEPDPE